MGVRYLQINAKCSDMCDVSFLDENGKLITNSGGYPPSGLGIGGGDFIRFRLDLVTGTIVDWKPPKYDDLMEAMSDGG